MKTHLGLAAGLAAVLWSGGGPADALAPPDPQPVAVSVETAPTRIDFLAGKLLIARYEFGPDTAKPYFWPLNAPDGKPVTRAWPMEKGYAGAQTDHVHQKSAWFCHGDVIPEGVELKQKVKGVEGVDFWSEAPGHGRIVVTKVGGVDQTKNHAQVTTVNEWLTGDGKKILDETRVLHVYNFGPSDLIVFDIDLHASVCPITFGDTKEGSLGVRVRESVTEKVGKGVLTNAEGNRGEGEKDNKDRKGCWGLTSAWCDYSGPVENDLAGVAIFADPGNPYPTAWHARGYGLLAANPFGRAKSGFPALAGQTELVKLAKGDHLKLRYGIFLHLGDAKSGKVAEAFEEFKKLKGK
jgi:hypothetical protein